MMPVKNVAVLGADSGGYATAVDLTQRGFSANLFKHPRFAANIQEAKEKGARGGHRSGEGGGYFGPVRRLGGEDEDAQEKGRSHHTGGGQK